MTSRTYTIGADVMARKDLSASGKLLYGVLAYRQGRNKYSWAGVRRLAKDMGCSTATVERSIGQLEKAGLVVVTRGRPDKQGLRRCGNKYAINRTRNGTVTVPEVARSDVVCQKFTSRTLAVRSL